MSLRHATRYSDTYTPREIAKLAREEGFDVATPESPQGTSPERAQQIIEQKEALFRVIAQQRAARQLAAKAKAKIARKK